ncbi:MAG: hypothetical protein DRR06_09535 [Gammaproteobacteria bacterium]|nr:MAG: hypothetical protein DRR06_09535 [Gammaproteobacteria bacterium]RLA51705.1 MAG: hypothetical protein DRR42_09665 [Gammaproteobacteria bacterium]
MNAVFAIACAKAEQLINTALDFAPDNEHLFDNIANKSLRITSHLPPCDVVISMGKSVITIQPATDSATDASLSGSMLALTLLAIEDQPIDHYQGPVKLNGDQAFVEVFRNCLQQADIDWEAWLATLIGDVPAHVFATTARQAKDWQEQAVSRSANGLEHYFQEELQSAPWLEGMGQFRDTVVKLGGDRQQLRQHLESLKARLLQITG